VPLTTMTMSRLRKEEIGNAAGIYNLMRNIGGSVGIASITTYLVRGSQAHQNYLAANVTATNPLVCRMVQAMELKLCHQGVSAFTAHQRAIAFLYRMVRQQSALLGYTDNFRLMAYLSLICIPICLCFARVRRHAGEKVEVVGEA
jgi:MFS transporter, DHA2 family, multidrug resistance protein